MTTTTRFALVGTWELNANGLGAGSIDDRWGVYENINLFADEDGSLWFIGMETVFLRPDVSIDPLKFETEVLKSGTDILTLETEMVEADSDLLIPGIDFLISDRADLVSSAEGRRGWSALRAGAGTES